MRARRCFAWVTILTALISLSILPADHTQAAAGPTLPALTLQPGEFYFSVDGIPRFIYVRNVTGYQQSHYVTVLDWVKAGGGLLARVVQHEVDHLNGILFIDRMDKQTKEELQPELDTLQAATKAALQEAPKK